MRLLFATVLLLISPFTIQGQSPFWKQIEWPFVFNSQYIQSVKPASDSSFWLLASSSESTGQSTGGAIASVSTDGQITEARVLESLSGQKVFLLDMAETVFGEKYAVLFSEESAVPSVVVNGRIFVAKFDAQWQTIWIKELKSGGNTSSNFAKIEVDQSGFVYFFYFDGSYIINCLQADGDLLWSRSIPSGIFPGGPSGSVNGDFELASNGQDLIVSMYAAPLQQTQFFRFDRFSGALSGSAGLTPGYLLSDVLPLPGNQTLAVCQSSLNYAERHFVLMDENFTVIRSWEMTDPRFFLHRLLPGRDSSFFVFADGFSNSCVYRMDINGTLLGGVQLQGVDDFGFRMKARAVFGGAAVVLPATLKPDIPGNTSLLLLDETLLLENCEPLPLCVDFRASAMTTQPVITFQGSAASFDTDLMVFWQDSEVRAADYCPAGIEINGVWADFAAPDTVCAGEVFQIEALRNGGASAWFWSFPGAQPDSSRNPAPGPLQYDLPGTYLIRQITVSECLIDTFEHPLTVLPQPSITLPPSQTICADTAFLLQPLVENATEWAWQDLYPELVRIVEDDGVFILNATNEGYCEVVDTVAVRFVTLDAFFELPEFVCTEQSVLIAAPSNPPGSVLRWTVSPPMSGLPSADDTLRLQWDAPGAYTIELRVENSGCLASDIKELEAFAAPVIELGPAVVRLPGNQALQIQPSVVPTQATAFWLDGSPSLTRLFTIPGTFIARAELDICVSEDTLVILPPFRVYQPNAFRPGSLQNEFFTVFPSEGDVVETLFVYDRWGALIFQGPGNPGWDGAYPDGRLPDNGVFVYRAVIRQAEGTLVEVSGDVTVIR